MKKLSAVRIGAAICASTLILPAAFAQLSDTRPESPANPPAKSPGRPAQMNSNPVAAVSKNMDDRAREKESAPSSADEAPRRDSVTQIVRSSEIGDRGQVVDTVNKRIDATKNEQESLQDTVDDLGPEARGRFKAVSIVADARRDLLETRLEALKKADPKEWESTRHSLATAIDQYSKAMDREREIASGKDPVPSDNMEEKSEEKS